MMPQPQRPTEAEIVEWLRLLVSPTTAIEIRAPEYRPPGKSKPQAIVRRFRSADLGRVARAAMDLSDNAPGTYLVLNGVKPTLLDRDGNRGASAKDIPRRRWLLVDCDPERGVKGASATDEEKSLAFEVAKAVRTGLRDRGWPEPITADSGNGAHLLYRIDLPAEDGGLVKSVLEALATLFDTEAAKVDRKVFDSPRLVKLYGTLAAKGEHTEERPHRFARVLKIPDEIEVVVEDLLRSLAEEGQPVEQAPAPTTARPTTRYRRDEGHDLDDLIERRVLRYLATIDPAIQGANGSGQAFKAAAKIGPGFNLDPETAFRLLWTEYNPKCQPPWSEKELRHKVTEAFKKEPRRGFLLDASRVQGGGAGTKGPTKPPARPKPASEPEPEAPPERPSVEINTQRHEVAANAIKALGNDPDLYRRGDQLVSVTKEENDLTHLTTRTTVKGVKGSPKIVVLSEAVIGERLTRHADFYKWVKIKDQEPTAVAAHPPDWLIKIVATRKGDWPGIRPLVAVAECPFPRPDGTIVEEPGYDHKTAVLYSPSMEFPPIPKRPTRNDARQAWDRIRRYVRYFPFPSEEDRIVFLAGLLGVIARHGIVGPMPGVAVNGNKAGIGKGYLVDGMVLPGTGRLAPITKYPYDPAEAGKVKTSIVRSGKTIVNFDNLRAGSRYGGDDVDSLLTAKVMDDRILGASEQTGELIVRLVCFVNGNNIDPVDDAYRRWLVCNLKTDLDHPERRRIEDENGNPVPNVDVQVLQNRGEIVCDALTILRAHALAGRPNGGWPPLGSFDHWDEVIRGAVWFATELDCTTTQQRAAEESQDRCDRMALLEGWWELPGGKSGERGLTCVEALKMVEDDRQFYQTLRNALLQRGSKGNLPDSRSLGGILKGLASTPIGEFKLMKHPVLKHKTVAWYVERTGDDEGGSGGSGGSKPVEPPGIYDTPPHVMMSESKSYSREKRQDLTPQIPLTPLPPIVIDDSDPINDPNFNF